MLIRNINRRKFIILSFLVFGAFTTSLKIKNNKILLDVDNKNNNNWMLHSNDY